MVVAVNLLGLPAAAVPAGLDEGGLPLGVQVIGPRLREDLCLDAAETIEAALGLATPIEVRPARAAGSARR
jgi:amidase